MLKDFIKNEHASAEYVRSLFTFHREQNLHGKRALREGEVHDYEESYLEKREGELDKRPVNLRNPFLYKNYLCGSGAFTTHALLKTRSAWKLCFFSQQID